MVIAQARCLKYHFDCRWNCVNCSLWALFNNAQENCQWQTFKHFNKEMTEGAILWIDVTKRITGMVEKWENEKTLVVNCFANYISIRIIILQPVMNKTLKAVLSWKADNTYRKYGFYSLWNKKWSESFYQNLNTELCNYLLSKWWGFQCLMVRIHQQRDY